MKQNRNRISMLSNLMWEKLEDPGDIKEEIVGFYKQLLGTCASFLPAVSLHKEWSNSF